MDISEIRGAVARGWCHEGNTHKVMDTDLAEAISQEVNKLVNPMPNSEGLNPSGPRFF